MTSQDNSDIPLEDQHWNSLYNDVLKVTILSFEYDFELRQATLYFPPKYCCDMSGAIKFVTAIDPKALSIQTIAGDQIDMCYFLKDNEWVVRGNILFKER